MIVLDFVIKLCNPGWKEAERITCCKIEKMYSEILCLYGEILLNLSQNTKPLRRLDDHIFDLKYYMS